jgi:hypothetical protein
MRTAATQRTRRELASLSVDETCALFGAIGLSTFAATCERDEIDGYVLASSAIFTPSMVEEVWPEAKAWQRAALLSKVADLRDVGVRVDLFARTSPSREAAVAPLPQTPRQRTLRSSPPLSPPTMRPAPPLRGGGGAATASATELARARAPSATYSSAHAAFASGRYAAALAIFDRLVIDSGPGRPGERRNTLTQGVHAGGAPATHALLFCSAACLERMGSVAAAEARYAAAAAAAEQGGGPAWRAHAALGSSMLKRGAFGDARLAFTTAIARFPPLDRGGTTAAGPSSPTRADTTALATLQFNLGVAWARVAEGLSLGAGDRASRVAKAQQHLCAAMRLAPALTAVRERALHALASLPNDCAVRDVRLLAQTGPSTQALRSPHRRVAPIRRALPPTRSAPPPPGRPRRSAHNTLETAAAAAVKRRHRSTLSKSVHSPALLPHPGRALNELRGYAQRHEVYGAARGGSTAAAGLDCPPPPLAPTHSRHIVSPAQGGPGAPRADPRVADYRAEARAAPQRNAHTADDHIEAHAALQRCVRTGARRALVAPPGAEEQREVAVELVRADRSAVPAEGGVDVLIDPRHAHAARSAAEREQLRVQADALRCAEAELIGKLRRLRSAAGAAPPGPPSSASYALTK